MGKETILLAKNWDEKRFVDGSFVSEKFDGVPVIITDLGAVSRQGERIRSVDHIVQEYNSKFTPRWGLVGELWIPNKDFAYIGGKVRGHDNCKELILMVYDVIDYFKDATYVERINPFLTYQPEQGSFIHSVYTTNLGILNASGLPLDKQGVLSRIEEVRTQPKAEGIIVRSPNHLFEAGKRSWGLMRWKHADTVDLPIIDISEAFTKDGDPTGMV